MILLRIMGLAGICMLFGMMLTADNANFEELDKGINEMYEEFEEKDFTTIKDESLNKFINYSILGLVKGAHGTIYLGRWLALKMPFLIDYIPLLMVILVLSVLPIGWAVTLIVALCLWFIENRKKNHRHEGPKKN